MSALQDTYCCDESLTPRVRTIFRSRQPAAPPAPAPIETQVSASGTPTHWTGLLAAILHALLPFQDALEAVRQVVRATSDGLPAPT